MPTNDKTIVLTGSFNPPTLAHKAMLQHAMDATGAIRGVFVPANNKYVTRKASRTPGTIVFTEDERRDMLLDMAHTDTRLEVAELEKDDDGRGITYETMKRARTLYPDTECMFLLGADKLRVLPRWRSIEPFLQDFRFIVTARDGIDPMSIVRSDRKLSLYEDRFVFIPALEVTEKISSSRFRKLVADNDPRARAMVTPYVWDIASRKIRGDDT